MKELLGPLAPLRSEEFCEMCQEPRVPVGEFPVWHLPVGEVEGMAKQVGDDELVNVGDEGRRLGQPESECGRRAEAQLVTNDLVEGTGDSTADLAYGRQLVGKIRRHLEPDRVRVRDRFVARSLTLEGDLAAQDERGAARRGSSRRSSASVNSTRRRRRSSSWRPVPWSSAGSLLRSAFTCVCQAQKFFSNWGLLAHLSA